jgi:hypothetical protein
MIEYVYKKLTCRKERVIWSLTLKMKASMSSTEREGVALHKENNSTLVTKALN